MVPLARAANETETEEEPSKSKVPLFWSPLLYMLIENSCNLAMLAPISFLLKSILLITCVQSFNGHQLQIHTLMILVNHKTPTSLLHFK